ncbi:hypothetical protein OG455_34600 [Kitasatospora sp. NBC_01287]|uniref:hypothetical protein n=1 Tax=Kitasatospora sp. NBC_01287 TaxID=2903573 RepID=UPI002256E81D|nr:hypothetical protein [Kitasatospora sp. NBC_01287]MCX4750580.1 hypothetical protein [Kitasatospora sp. NBC_01287]
MTTHAVIARPTPGGFAGRYVHYDGYPRAKVPVLLTAVRDHFRGDVQAAARFYLDDHPAGWDELGIDFTVLPDSTAPRTDPGAFYSRCLCHGPFAAEPQLIDQESTLPRHAWVYVLRPEGLQVIRSGERKSTRPRASHLLPWDTDPHAPLPAGLR